MNHKSTTHVWTSERNKKTPINWQITDQTWVLYQFRHYNTVALYDLNNSAATAI